MTKITLSKQLYVPQKVQVFPKKLVIKTQTVAPLHTLRFSSLKLSLPLQSYVKRGNNQLWSPKIQSLLPLYSRNSLSFNSNHSLSKQAVRYYATSTGPSSATQAAPKTADDLIKNVAWVDPEAETNPFQIRVLDLTPFSSEAKAFTKDPSVQKRFQELREESGVGYANSHPAKPKTASCSLEYPMIVGEEDREALESTLLNPEFAGPFFKAHSMEQKWDIYLINRKLYFCRSWAGNLVFTATISDIKEEIVEGDREVRLQVNSIEYASEAVQDDPEYAVRITDFLIKTYLFGDVSPFPLPPKLKAEASNIRGLVSNSFQWFGSDALYGTFEDTTPFLRKEGFMFPGEMDEFEGEHDHEHGEHCDHDHDHDHHHHHHGPGHGHRH
mmetsp:Transcript_5791/g.8100  ORF Transcript_5791/g.8100 Transcript_5791/m.8100 type:complete len:384 (+) Transcript_5791:3-1154(+)